jgi:4-hydroxybenzoate polyprenyltransferase
MDMCDYEGDKKNNIITVPVFFGKDNAWILSNSVITFNILTEFFALNTLYNSYISFIYFMVSSPYLLRSYQIYKNNYSKESIKKVLNKTNYQLFLILVYFLGLSFL